MTAVPAEHARIRESGSFRIDLPPDRAFELFTAAGERLWVPGWSPQILGPLPQQPGLVFLTGAGSEFTIWTVIESDPDRGRLRYSRVTPGSRAGIVAVSVVAADGGSEVEVAYDLTALEPNGTNALEPYAPHHFAKMMDEWRSLIGVHTKQSGNSASSTNGERKAPTQN